MNIEAIAKRLVELCREGKFEQAQKELYADDAESVEPVGSQEGPFGDVKGLPAILEKGEKFRASLEAIHGTSASDPVIANNWFSIALMLDVTMKVYGRVKMQEICVYRVHEGKIVHEQFFYDMG
jgi:hypothetical protein